MTSLIELIHATQGIGWAAALLLSVGAVCATVLILALLFILLPRFWG